MITNLEDVKTALMKIPPTEILNAIGYTKSKPKRSNGELRDYCPIHGGDNQRSLSVNERTGAFHCHNGGCNKSGSNNIELYRQSKGVDFITAVLELARLFGLHIEQKAMQSVTASMTPTQKAHKECKKKDLGDQEKLQKSRERAANIWVHSQAEGTHPYFRRKCIEPLPEVRYGLDERGNAAIVVPYRDVEGRIQAIQFVSESGKFFASGTSSGGAFFNLGLIAGSTTAYLCEGMATAVSIWMSEKKSVTTISCASASNIPKVAAAIRDTHQELKMIICIDDDKAGDDVEKKVMDLGLSGVSFRRPCFIGLDRGEKDKDFNDIHRLAGLEKVKEQLKEERSLPKDEAEKTSILSAGRLTIEAIENYYQEILPGIDIGLKTGDDVHDKILIPSGGYSVFCAPTKHGKTAVLVNAIDRHLWKDPKSSVVFLTLEELDPPVLIRFLNRFLNEKFSQNNALTLASYFRSKNNRFSMFSADWKRDLRDGDSSAQIFLKNIEAFNNLYLKTGRLRILSFSSFGGILSQVETLCRKIEEFKKWIPDLRMIAIDYLQLLGMQKPGNRSRDEVLKEVCLQLKDVAAQTGLAILTAAQFNRTIQNEDDLHPSAIGEAGSIERHAALVIGMWNRRFKQMINGKVDLKKEISDEILLSIMLNRYGLSGQRIIAPYNGNIGLIDFDHSKTESGQKKLSASIPGKIELKLNQDLFS